MHLHHQDNEEEGNIILLSLVSPSAIKTWLFSKFSWWHKLALFQVVYKRLVLDCDQVYQFVTRHFLPVIVYNRLILWHNNQCLGEFPLLLLKVLLLLLIFLFFFFMFSSLLPIILLPQLLSLYSSPINSPFSSSSSFYI